MCDSSGRALLFKHALIAMFGFSQQPTDDERPPESASALSVLGEDTKAQGSFDLKEDDLRVDGALKGEVRTEGHVHVSPGGVVEGDIQAGSIRIAGTAEGILHARDDLVVLDTASVHGILCAEALSIKDGAEFEGGMCDTADRIPALKAVFTAAEKYTIPDLSPSSEATGTNPSLQAPERAERSVTLDIEESSPPENSSPFRPPQEGDGLPETPSSSIPASSSQTDTDPAPQNTEDTGNGESLDKIEW